MAGGRLRWLIAMGSLGLASCAAPVVPVQEPEPRCDLICHFLRYIGDEPAVPITPAPPPPAVKPPRPVARPSPHRFLARPARKTVHRSPKSHGIVRPPAVPLKPSLAASEARSPTAQVVEPPLREVIPGSPAIADPWFKPTQYP